MEHSNETKLCCIMSTKRKRNDDELCSTASTVPADAGPFFLPILADGMSKTIKIIAV